MVEFVRMVCCGWEGGPRPSRPQPVQVAQMMMPKGAGSVLLEVVAPLPGGLAACVSCERMMDLAGVGARGRGQMQAEYPPEVLAEAERLAVLLQDLARRHGERLQIRLMDVQSLPGLGRSLRYGLRRYPAFIVNRRQVFAGWEEAPLERALERAMVQAEAGRAPALPRWWGRLPTWLRRAVRAASEILYGMTVFDWVRDLRRERGEIEHLFVLVTFGDIIGLPLLPPYYALRLLPYAVPCIEGWKRCLLRERDLTDLTGLIEGID